jgi:hypothetical protein
VGSLLQYYLFSTPSFLSGIVRALDIGGHYDAYNFSRTPEEADISELTDDWAKVCKALMSSWARIAREDPQFIREFYDVLTAAHHGAAAPLELPEDDDEFEEAPLAK